MNNLLPCNKYYHSQVMFVIKQLCKTLTLTKFWHNAITFKLQFVFHVWIYPTLIAPYTLYIVALNRDCSALKTLSQDYRKEEIEKALVQFNILSELQAYFTFLFVKWVINMPGIKKTNIWWINICTQTWPEWLSEFSSDRKLWALLWSGKHKQAGCWEVARSSK